MITKHSPEGQLLSATWRTMLGMAGPVSEQFRWILTGQAAIIGLMVANLDSLQKVVSPGHLRWSLGLLVISLVLASFAYLLSVSLRARHDVMAQFERLLGSPEGREVLSRMTMEQADFLRQFSAPLFGPLKWFMLRSARNGAKDPFAVEKGGISLMVWQAYAMWLSVALAAAGLFSLVAGLG